MGSPDAWHRSKADPVLAPTGSATRPAILAASCCPSRNLPPRSQKGVPAGARALRQRTRSATGRGAEDALHAVGRVRTSGVPAVPGHDDVRDGRGLGADETEARKQLEVFAEAGGNFIDTANKYTDGSAETIIGRLLAGQLARFGAVIFS